MGLRVHLGNSLLAQSRKTKCGSPTRKLVYMCLCDHADEKTGIAFPSVKTISQECELSERAVRKSLRGLESLSLISTNQRGDKHLVSEYKLCIQGGTTCPLTRNGVPPKGEPRSAKGEPRAPQASGSHTEATRGGTPPIPKDFELLILRAKEEQERLKNRGAHINAHGIEWHNEPLRLEFVELSGKIKIWKTKMLGLLLK